LFPQGGKGKDLSAKTRKKQRARVFHSSLARRASQKKGGFRAFSPERAGGSILNVGIKKKTARRRSGRQSINWRVMNKSLEGFAKKRKAFRRPARKGGGVPFGEFGSANEKKEMLLGNARRLPPPSWLTIERKGKSGLLGAWGVVK